MSKLIIHLLAGLGLLIMRPLPALAAEGSPGLEALQGKWVTVKTNREGQRHSQVIEFKKDKTTFQILEEDKQLRLLVKGTVKTEKTGPLQLLTIFDMEAGRTAGDLQPVDDRRTAVYTIREGKLIVASNFDKERDQERPGIEFYERAEGIENAAGDENKLVGKWKMKLSMGDQELDYDLRIGKSDGKLEAAVISPRSGEHKARSIAFKDNELLIEVDREVQGNNVTIVYKGKLMGEELSGTATAKGFEDQFTGKFKATK